MPSLLLASTVTSFIEAFLLPYGMYFRNKGWRVDAIANGISESGECKVTFDHVWDIGWSRTPVTLSNIRAATAVNRILGTHPYDIVHVHTPVASLVCRYAAHGRTGPITIYTAHGFHFHEHASFARNLIFLTLERTAGRRWTDYLVVINHEDEVAAHERGIIRHDRIVYMPGIGVDLCSKFNPDLVSDRDVCAFRSSLGIGADAQILLIVAEFNPRKRHHDALRAFARIAGSSVHLVLAGGGPGMRDVQTLARSLGIAPQVHFVGIRRDIPVLIRSARALILPSDREGLPRSVMEAMALGVPVIGSDIRGTRELLAGGAGYMYPLGDIDQLTDAMRRVLARPSEVARTVTLARQRVEMFGLQGLLAMHEQLYERAMREKRCACNRTNRTGMSRVM